MIYKSSISCGIRRCSACSAFTLIEVVVGLFLMVLLSTSTILALMVFQKTVYRQSAYNSALAVVSTRLNEIKNENYAPASSDPLFRLGTHVLTPKTYTMQVNNSDSILDVIVEGRTTFSASGHLVELGAKYQLAGKENTVSLTGFINSYSSQ